MANKSANNQKELTYKKYKVVELKMYSLNELGRKSNRYVITTITVAAAKKESKYFKYHLLW